MQLVCYNNVAIHVEGIGDIRMAKRRNLSACDVLGAATRFGRQFGIIPTSQSKVLGYLKSS
jgi:hypothetical protein